MSKKLHDATLAKWRTRELALMGDLVPLLKQRAKGQNISGLSGYEP